ncbi:hypothetical protein ASD59_08550 [Brevundimonas sp. Root608]|nr:hypothetical protein ASD59_08550 [Brevundimonas sp. Root608]
MTIVIPRNVAFDALISGAPDERVCLTGRTADHDCRSSLSHQGSDPSVQDFRSFLTAELKLQRFIKRCLPFSLVCLSPVGQLPTAIQRLVIFARKFLELAKEGTELERLVRGRLLLNGQGDLEGAMSSVIGKRREAFGKAARSGEQIDDLIR